MKFIFPQNYKFNNKILGVFDYSTAIINIVWYVFVYIIINFIFNNLKIKIAVSHDKVTIKAKNHDELQEIINWLMEGK